MESEAESPDAILHLDSEIVEENSSQEDSEKEPMRHRMHRSAVRPFLCCGSEVSLVSLVDTIEEESSTDFLDGSGQMLMSPSSKTGKLEAASIPGCRRLRKRPEKMQQSKSKKKFWSLRGKLGGKFSGAQNRTDSGQLSSNSHRKRNGNKAGSSLPPNAGTSHFRRFLPNVSVNSNVCLPFITNFDMLYPIRDVDEARREERAREIEEGIDVSSQWTQHTLGSVDISGGNHRNVVTIPPHRLLTGSVTFPVALSSSTSSDYEDSIYGDTSVLCLQALAQHLPSVFQQTGRHPAAHSQVEYIHCLVPDLTDITKCSFYWGVMDRYEAETLLENKPEGTFLLRDSAQEDFLFSVSFRRYNRSLHARIEQWNHLFSFDAHDPAVFSCDSVVGLIEHYKDPECCMFFEPMLTLPLNRTFCFSLKHLCRSVICSNMKYDDINTLPLPSSQKEYLKYYHYKQKVRTKRFDVAP